MVDPQGGGLSPRNRPQKTKGRPWLVPVIVVGAVLLTAIGFAAVKSMKTSDTVTATEAAGQADATTDAGGDEASTDTTQVLDPDQQPLPPYDGWVNPASSGRMWSEKVPGVLTFRGNPTRTYYGKGPVPKAPKILWSYPETGAMCGKSTDGSGTQTWCGMGWTGNPNVYETGGKTIVSFGAYDYAVHWIDYNTGADVLPPFKTGDIIKGTVTTDPDGFPLTYSGSRDNYYRILATDRPQPVELWKLSAYDGVQQMWNDDWDGSGLIIDDYLFEGGENSWFYIVKLNRAYGPDGKVTVNPEIVFKTPGWDAEELKYITDRQVSIENSVAISGNTVYFANSGGLVQGWDITGLKAGKTPERIFRFWTGDDTDASVVIDKDGFLYVGSEFERHNERSTQIGQIMKLDPRKPDDPLVWSVKDESPGKQGIWGTLALANGVVYADTNGGRVLGIDQMTGQVLWQKELKSQTWPSPVVVDNVLIVGDCKGVLHAWDVSNPTVDPPEIWTVQLDGCIEATPTVWKGRIFVGARGGKMYAIGDS